MQLYLAAYDPSCQAENGTYWTFAHPEIPSAALDETYYSHLRRALPADVTGDELTKVIGLAALDEWVCYFRVVDGGRDRRNRPGRYVFVCAFARRTEARAQDPDEVWESQAVAELVNRSATECPVSKPSASSFSVDSKIDSCDPALLSRLIRLGRLEWSDKEARREMTTVCAYLPEGIQWAVRASEGPGIWIGKIERCSPAPRTTRSNPEPAIIPKQMASIKRCKLGALRSTLLATLVVAVIAAGGAAAVFGIWNFVGPLERPIDAQADQPPRVIVAVDQNAPEASMPTTSMTSPTTWWMAGDVFPWVAGTSAGLVIGIAVGWIGCSMLQRFRK